MLQPVQTLHGACGFLWAQPPLAGIKTLTDGSLRERSEIQQRCVREREGEMKFVFGVSQMNEDLSVKGQMVI